MNRASRGWLAAAVAGLLAWAGVATAQCVGDCDGTGAVTVDEIVLGVNIALGSSAASTCPVVDADHSGEVTVDEIIQAINNALGGCPVLATPTPSPSPSPTATRMPVAFRVGVAAVSISPCGNNPDYSGPITANGVWGEQFTDNNGNGRWDTGEPYVDDPGNTAIDSGSRRKYDGIYLAGFGNDRIAKGCADPIWARALVIEGGTKKVALVSLDVVGSVNYGSYYGFNKAQQMVDPSLGIDAFIYSSTHSHEGPDTLGLWGTEQFRDGKFPLYLQFVDRQVAKAINTAGASQNMKPAQMVAAVTNPSLDPELLGLQVRTGCRPPWYFDQELRALRFVDGEGATIATLINWSTHPESLESDNEMVSSDFPHYLRQRIEAQLGGTAVYFTGDLGAVEIVGDTCVGNADPRANGSNEFDRREDLGFARTQRIGETVADAALRALSNGQRLSVAAVDARFERYHLAGSNALFSFANELGILDLDKSVFDVNNCPPGTGICVPIEQQLLTLLDAEGHPLVQLATLPGEVFPELIDGVAEHKRKDCPAAETGLPYEPAVRSAMTAPYKLFVGLSPDELGYIVPGYDFYAAPSIDEEASDVCRGQSYDANFPGRHTPSHYHESLSVGADIAAAVNCYVLKMLGRDAEVNADPACRRALRLP